MVELMVSNRVASTESLMELRPVDWLVVSLWERWLVGWLVGWLAVFG